jgi:hypothetical protein
MKYLIGGKEIPQEKKHENTLAQTSQGLLVMCATGVEMFLDLYILEIGEIKHLYEGDLIDGKTSEEFFENKEFDIAAAPTTYEELEDLTVEDCYYVGNGYIMLEILKMAIKEALQFKKPSETKGFITYNGKRIYRNSEGFLVELWYTGMFIRVKKAKTLPELMGDVKFSMN